MRWSRLSGSRRLAVIVLAIFAGWTVFLWLFLPYDNPVLLSVRFLSHQLFSFAKAPFASDKWVYELPTFPISLEEDVAYIIKTGYGTQARLAPQLDALDLTSNTALSKSLLIIADFATELVHGGETFEIHDAVLPLTRNEALEEYSSHEKLVKYWNMTETITKDSTPRAGQIAREIGWELDAMKFIPGLDLAWRKMPDKQWYIMLDDDTFIIKPSLEAILGHLDPSKAQYIGNAIGDYKGRFAHGGSAIILSRPAMSRLFDEYPNLVTDAYVESLNETWGDKLVATTFMKMGTYLDERYAHFFNGEPPKMTKVQTDRFCSPIVSFHGLARSDQMKNVGTVFRGIKTPVRWGDLWSVYGQPNFDVFTANPLRMGQDHVGRTDESTKMVENVESADKCVKVCDHDYNSCLAWTWDKVAKTCAISPWYIIGDKPTEKYSGLNVDRLRELAMNCRR